ncbi:MAG: hypothetical protein ACRDY4_09000 [Acidimicrobiia bacterium]
MLVVLAGCSSVPGRSDTTGSDPLSQDEYVDEANEICQASQAAASKVAAPSLADPAAVEQAIDETVAIQRRALRKLRELEPPERDVPGVESWLDLTADAIDQMEKIREGVANGDREAITTAIDEGGVLVADAEEFAAAYGLTECSTAEPDEDGQEAP